MRTHTIAAFVALTIAVPGVAIAAGKTYWVDSQGQAVRDGSGDCVHAIAHGTRFPECGGATPAPEPEPAPVATPAPTPVVAPVVVAAPVAPPKDSDGDGVDDAMDNCPDTLPNTLVDAH